MRWPSVAQATALKTPFVVAAMKAMRDGKGTPVGSGMAHTAVRCASVPSFAASLRVLPVGSAQRGREQFASEIITIWALGWQQYRTSRWMRRPQVRSPRAACARRGSQIAWEICVGAEPKVSSRRAWLRRSARGTHTLRLATSN